jgi:hypothetical protein
MEDDYLIDLFEACGKRVRNKLRHSFGTLRFSANQAPSHWSSNLLTLFQTLEPGLFWAGRKPRIPNVHDVDHSW